MMTLPFEIDRMDSHDLFVFIDRLKQIYTAMDSAYGRLADRYGFKCDGCEDNCCRTRFYHHTVIEYAYLKQGLLTLDAQLQDRIQSQAMTVVAAVENDHSTPGSVKLMCPLNSNARCILYAYRPMICRLHGIPHELKKPGQSAIRVPGCNAFDSRYGDQPYMQFDRTPFYRDMAGLEMEVKQALGFGGKLKMSIAQMILNFYS
jgi:Fe-S-cluster containining protein